VGLVASVVLGAETPVYVWEDGLSIEVYCPEDTAAYFKFPSAYVESREKRGLSAFSTFLAILDGKGDYNSTYYSTASNHQKQAR
jgi:predicted  nucleic acid-binding Zn ribbon protein